METSGQNSNPLSRREFIGTAVAVAAVASELTLAPLTALAAETGPSTEKILIGFQAEVTYILQYGVARFFDDVQTRASVNAIFLHGNPFEISGPIVPGEFQILAMPCADRV